MVQTSIAPFSSWHLQLPGFAVSKSNQSIAIQTAKRTILSLKCSVSPDRWRNEGGGRSALRTSNRTFALPHRYHFKFQYKLCKIQMRTPRRVAHSNCASRSLAPEQTADSCCVRGQRMNSSLLPHKVTSHSSWQPATARSAMPTPRFASRGAQWSGSASGTQTIRTCSAPNGNDVIRQLSLLTDHLLS